jgi:hypothetical protein
MTSVLFAIVLAFGLIYMAVVNEERQIQEHAAKSRKREPMF